MVMRGMITMGLLCVLATCVKPPVPPGGGGRLVRCSDPGGCTQSNGTGVYFEEGGAAGLGPMQLLITHFINGQSSMRFQGRYLDPNSQLWRPLSEPGTVYRADLRDQMNLTVVSLSESGTMPTWTLQSGTQPPFPVTGAELKGLKIYINFAIAGMGQTQYVLEFDGPVNSQDRTVNQTIGYHLLWSRLAGGPAHVVYCTAATGAPDPIVFQQGIDVRPFDGTVALNPNFVTMSCKLGAPATVYRWGYNYTSADLFYFAAGIHMKRASYCGDAQYFTVAGTRIEFTDDQGRSTAARTAELEAWWTPRGASCADPEHARHGDIVLKNNFKWTCGGVRLNRCQPPPGSPPVAPYLVDSPL
jgi:ADYC domain-containing protein